MDLNFYLHATNYESRLYLSRNLCPEDLKKLITTSAKSLSGAGIKIYSQFWGRILKILGLVTEWNTKIGTIYLNTNSLKKYFIRMLLVMPSTSCMTSECIKFHDILSLPLSPLSIQTGAGPKFKLNEKTLMSCMHCKYLMFKKLGYKDTLLNQIDLPKILSVIG